MTDCPIPSHPTWDILDSSKLKTFQDCPRKYFYEYVLGWCQETGNIHLVFGEAVHRALEHIYSHGFTVEVVEQAFDLMESYYREEFPDEENDVLRAPKTPAFAKPLLIEYIRQYQQRDTFKVLETEIAGSAPIHVSGKGQKVLHFRLDLLIEKDDGIWIMDHKTSSWMSQRWMDGWLLDFQISFYTHVAYCLFESDAVQGVVINGIETRMPTKKQEKAGQMYGCTGETPFQRLPIKKTPDMMRAFLWDANHWYDWVKMEHDRFAEVTVEQPVMHAFPRNPGACTKYGKCLFLDFCAAWSNPVRKAKKPPPGMEVQRWDPRDHEKSAKRVVHLEKGGSQ